MNTAAQSDQKQMIIGRLERLPLSWWHVKTRFIVGAATFFDAFDALAIAVTLPVLAGLWHLSSWQIGWMISIGYVGQIVGAIAFGWLAERYGRIKALVGSVAILSIMSLVCAFAQNYEQLLIARGIQGIGLGGEVPIAAAYISEIAKTDTRGRFVLVYENVFPVGVVVAALSAVWIVPHIGWECMFVIGAAPATLIFLLIRAVPESPRWLVGHGRLSEAQTVVDRLEREISKGKPELLPPIVKAPFVSQAPATLLGLFEGPYLQRTVVVWSLWFIAALVSYTLTVWLPTIYRTQFHVPVADALKFSVTSNVAGLLGGLTAAYLVDIWGRRTWFIVAFFASSAPLFWLGYNAEALTASMVLYAATICAFFANSLLLALYLYTPEVYPTRNRALGTSVATAWQRIGTIVGPLFLSYSLGSFGLGAAFTAFAVCAVVAGVIATLFMSETKQRVLEEMSP